MGGILEALESTCELVGTLVNFGKESSLLAVALFNLAPHCSVEDYASVSRDIIRPGMAQMPSVLGFKDYVVLPTTMAGTLSDWQVSEVVQITSVADFHRDNSELPGKQIADHWNSVVASSSVFFLADLLHFKFTDEVEDVTDRSSE